MYHLHKYNVICVTTILHLVLLYVRQTIANITSVYVAWLTTLDFHSKTNKIFLILLDLDQVCVVQCNQQVARHELEYLESTLLNVFQ